MGAESAALIDSIINVVYFMRGSIDYFDFYELTYIERERISKFLDERLKSESKKPIQANRVY